MKLEYKHFRIKYQNKIKNKLERKKERKKKAKENPVQTHIDSIIRRYHLRVNDAIASETRIPKRKRTDIYTNKR